MKLLTNYLKKFISKINFFLEQNYISFIFTKEKIKKLKLLLDININKNTRNYIFLIWLRNFFIYF